MQDGLHAQPIHTPYVLYTSRVLSEWHCIYVDTGSMKDRLGKNRAYCFICKKFPILSSLNPPVYLVEARELLRFFHFDK